MRKLILLFSIVLGFEQGKAANFNSKPSAYNNCIQISNKLNNPYSRDTRKVSCFKMHVNNLNSSTCIKLASIMEYTSIADELLSFCAGKFGTDANKCIKLASRMTYGENADLSLWSCLQKQSIKKNKPECLKISRNMIFPHNQDKAKELCLYENDI